MSDEELVKSFREGDEPRKAFDAIVRTYGERLYWHIRKMVISHDDANDVLQNCLVKAWNGLPGFREESKLFTWLYRIATNEVITFLKRRRTHRFQPLSEVSRQLVESLHADPLFRGDEIELKLQKAIHSLPNKQRMVFCMRYYDELKYEEISKILHTSVGALKASYHHAVSKIEAYIKQN
ncbi:MAG: RNA polymerase sigma factor [Prevotellaceae bacterium]|jgi:RNA polymerase sigma-70 factor (ECF subfamily)|nr:RNA polymerase sigma factor [Prevotellaceae bacterium]